MRVFALVLLACLSLQASRVASLGSRDDKLIGWSENYKADIHRKSVGKTTTTEVRVLSWEPRIFHLKHVLTDGKVLCALWVCIQCALELLSTEGSNFLRRGVQPVARARGCLTSGFPARAPLPA